VTQRAGSSLVEILVAVVVLAAGLLGGAALVAAAARRAATAAVAADALRTAAGVPVACPATAGTAVVDGVRVEVAPLPPHAARVSAWAGSGRRVTVLRAEGCAP
jgi:Tfp pilus assembly protein PilV